jgi:phosphoglycolate phosphatase
VVAAKVSVSKTVTNKSLFPKTKVDLVVLDLDGTLIDATADLVESVNHTLTEFKRPTLPAELITSHVGHGVRNLLKQSIESTGSPIDGEFDKALNFLLAHYYQNCLKQTFLYPGVLETLNALKAQGKIISLCTNKSLRPSQKILEGFGISQFFTTVVAGNSFPEKKPHPMGLEHILKQANTTADRAVMVGDSSVDIQVGKAAGFYTCGCSYGLRPIDEIKLAQPNLIVDRFDQLLEYFH